MPLAQAQLAWLVISHVQMAQKKSLPFPDVFGFELLSSFLQVRFFLDRGVNLMKTYIFFLCLRISDLYLSTLYLLICPTKETLLRECALLEEISK